MADPDAGGAPPVEPTFAPAAEAEFLAAIRFDARRRFGLGRALLAAVEATVARVAPAVDRLTHAGGPALTSEGSDHLR